MVPDTPTKVLLDTNVILEGSLSLRSHASDLGDLSETVFVTTTQILEEVDLVIHRVATDTKAIIGAGVLLNAFLKQLRVEIIDFYTPNKQHDWQVALAAASLACDWICTYNLKDLTVPRVLASTPPARTPRGLLRELEPYRHLIEVPRLGAAGTLLVFARHYHEDALGELLLSGDGTLVYTDCDRRLVVRRPDGTERRAHNPLWTDGYAYAFSFRYKPGGSYEADLWVDGDYVLPPRYRVGSGGKALVLHGTALFGEPVQTRLALGKNYAFAGEPHGLAGTDSWVKDPELRLAVKDGTLDHVRSSGIGDLVERINTVRIRNQGDVAVIAVTLRSPNQRSLLAVPRRSKQ